MSAYLLTWNPDRFEWTDLHADAVAVVQGKAAMSTWSCGNSTAIPVDSRFFLYRQGKRGRGIVGSGWTTRASFRDLHWDPERRAKEDQTNYVGIALDALIDPDRIKPMSVEHIVEGPLAAVNWNTPASGIRIDAAAASLLDDMWLAHGDGWVQNRITEDAVLSAVEGLTRTAMIRHRSRERALRGAKLGAARKVSPDGRLRCEVPGCNFDFQERYGELGENFAEVHHLLPLGNTSTPTITTLEGLAIVCSNCHSMIHRGGGCRPMTGLIAREV